jgi:hypothetical protein
VTFALTAGGSLQWAANLVRPKARAELEIAEDAEKRGPRK